MPDQPPPGHWVRVESHQLLDRPPWFRVYADTWRLPSGKTIPDFLRVDGRDYVTVLAVDDRERVLVFDGFRPGCMDVVLQFPAGYVDDADPDPLTAARRELAEEAGLAAGRWDHLGRFVADGNYKMTVTDAYLARDLTSVRVDGSDDPEAYRQTWIPLDEVTAGWRAGRFQPAATAAALGLALDRLTRSPTGSV